MQAYVATTVSKLRGIVGVQARNFLGVVPATIFQTTMTGSAGDMKSPPSPTSSRPAATAANGAQLTCARRCSVVVADALFGVVLAGALLLLLSGVADAVADSTNEYASGSFPLNEHGFDAKQTTLWGYRYASSPFVWVLSSFPQHCPTHTNRQPPHYDPSRLLHLRGLVRRALWLGRMARGRGVYRPLGVGYLLGR